MLLDLISEWAGIINDSYAEPCMEEIKEVWMTRLAWQSGPGTHEAGKNGSAYYRIQGPKHFPRLGIPNHFIHFYPTNTTIKLNPKQPSLPPPPPTNPPPPFTDNEQHARWSNFPTGVVPRGGISFKQMTEPQRDAAMKLLAVVLSPMGLEKVNQIRQADDDFKTNGSKRGRGGRGPGGPPPGEVRTGSHPEDETAQVVLEDDRVAICSGSELYYFSFLGKPSITDPWMFQFGGHHLALNITIAGSKGVLTPTLTGAQPAAFQLDGKTIRPLGRESDKALALLQSLDEKQRQQAVLNYQASDLVLGPGQDGKKIAAEGLKASSMNEKQQAILLDIIAEWAGILNDTSATARMAEM